MNKVTTIVGSILVSLPLLALVSLTRAQSPPDPELVALHAQHDAAMELFRQLQPRYGDEAGAIAFAPANATISLAGQTNCTTYTFGFTTNTYSFPGPGEGSDGIRARTFLPASASYWDIWMVEICVTNGNFSERLVGYTNGWIYSTDTKNIIRLKRPWQPPPVAPPITDPGQVAAQ